MTDEAQATSTKTKTGKTKSKKTKRKLRASLRTRRNEWRQREWDLERRQAWDRYAGAGPAATGSAGFPASGAGYADFMLAERDKRFGREPA